MAYMYKVEPELIISDTSNSPKLMIDEVADLRSSSPESSLTLSSDSECESNTESIHDKSSLPKNPSTKEFNRYLAI